MDPAGKQCYEKSLVFLGLNKWMDSKAVHMLSKFSATHPVKQVKRRIKGYKNKDAVKFPLVIQQHNKYMGEVDIMDQKKIIINLTTDQKTSIISVGFMIF